MLVARVYRVGCAAGRVIHRIIRGSRQLCTNAPVDDGWSFLFRTAATDAQRRRRRTVEATRTPDTVGTRGAVDRRKSKEGGGGAAAQGRPRTTAAERQVERSPETGQVGAPTAGTQHRHRDTGQLRAHRARAPPRADVGVDAVQLQDAGGEADRGMRSM